MKSIGGFMWPDADRDAHKVLLSQVVDLEFAIGLCEKMGRTGLCLQAGGNVGVFPKRLARSFRRVISYEPVRENFACMKENLSDISNLEIYLAALSNEDGELSMALTPRNAGAPFAAGTITGEEAEQGLPVGAPVPSIAIDGLCLPTLDLLVLDIEGYEPLALEGGRETIEKFRPVLMLEDKGLSRRYGDWPKGWSSQIPGYRVVKNIHRDVVLVPDESDAGQAGDGLP